MNISDSLNMIYNLKEVDIINIENSYYLLFFIFGAFIIYIISQKNLLEKIIKLIYPMFWIWYALKSNIKIVMVVIFFMIAMIIFNYDILQFIIFQCWNLFIIALRFVVDNFIIYVGKNGLLPLFMGLLFGLFFWKYDLLKNSESSKKEDINNHKSDKSIVFNEEDDYFGIWDKLNAIDNVLIKTDLLLNHKIIALYGDWGSGKSSIIETLRDKYKKENKFKTIFNGKTIKEELITIKFDAWKYEKEDNLPYVLLEFILSELENHNKANLEIKTKIRIIKDKLLNSGKIVFKSISGKIDILGIIEIGLEQNEDKQKEIDNLFEGFEILSNILKKNNKRLIVFIDDLDRCEVENVLSLLSSIKSLFASGDNINYFCAVDKEAVSKALVEKYKDKIKSEEYLEKIFNFSFHMPECSVEKFVKQYEFFNDENAEKLAEFFEYIKFTNPRHLKKVLNKYEYLVKIKNSENVDNLKDLIPMIIGYNKGGYLFDTIFVLYFIVLYEFYYEKYLEIKNIDDKLNNYAGHFRHIGWDININEHFKDKPITYTKDIIRKYMEDKFNIKFKDVIENIYNYKTKEEQLSSDKVNQYEFKNTVKIYNRLNSELLKLVFLFTPLITNMKDKEFGIFDNAQPDKIAGKLREDYLWKKINREFKSIYNHTISNMEKFLGQFEHKNDEILTNFCKYLISNKFFEIIKNDSGNYNNEDYTIENLFKMAETLL